MVSFDVKEQSSNNEENDREINGKNRPFVKFNRNVVYQRCLDEKQLGQSFGLTYKFIKNETKLVRMILEGHGFEAAPLTSAAFNIMWTGEAIKPTFFQTLLPFQRINHFPKSSELTRKDRLFKNIQKMQQNKGFKHFNFIPTSFVLPNDIFEFRTTIEKEKGIWIVKPTGSSQGRGIYLINNFEDVRTDESFIVSRYIENPLLIDGYKFDIRLYVAVTSFDPLVIYLYEEGLTRFSTVKYDRNVENLSNLFIHLTNYTVNKRNHRYVRCDDPDVEDFGNKWTMSAMLRLLKSEGKDTFTLMMAIEDIIIKTFLSVEQKISDACQTFVPDRSNCFEVYGFDILIDDRLKPWLIEVNLSPSLSCDAPIDLKIKSQMICDLFNVISIPLMNPVNYFDQINSQSPTNKQNCTILNVNKRKELNSNEYDGLSNEHVRIIKKIKEENSQSGGFRRIFPGEDTFEFFSILFQKDKNSLNKIVHQYFYPCRWTINYSNNENKLRQTRRNHIQRSKYLSTVYNSLNKNQLNINDLQQSIERYQLYLNSLSNLAQQKKADNEQSVSSTCSNEQRIKRIKSTSIENVHSSVSDVNFRTKKRINRKKCINELSESILSRDGSEIECLYSIENQPRKSALRVSSSPKPANHGYRFYHYSPVVNQTKKKTIQNDSLTTIDDQDTNRYVVDELNEISFRQHRRQYSGTNYFNALHVKSSARLCDRKFSSIQNIPLETKKRSSSRKYDANEILLGLSRHLN